MTRTAALLAAAAVVAGLAIGTVVALRGPTGDPFVDCRDGVVAGGTAAIGGPFALTAADGRRVTEAEAIAGPTLVYFGYSFCPDFCPTDLARNALAADLLAERGVDVGQVFVSIDPARDTPEAVGAFAEAIHPDLLGLTGSAAHVEAAAKAYRVYYRKSGDDPEFYRSEVTSEAVADSVACYAQALAS